MILLWQSIRALFMYTILLGVIYPAAVLLTGATLARESVVGSPLVNDGVVVGSKLVGQHFRHPRNFWSRPSETAPEPYQAKLSAGSNWALSNPALQARFAERLYGLRAVAGEFVPVDLITASASGLDPHISPAAARFQAARVAQTRGLAIESVHDKIVALTEGRTFGLLGEPRVNVLLLNRELDRQ